MSDIQNKIQIIAFTTNDTNPLINDIIDKFFTLHEHTILKRSKEATAFLTKLPESSNPIKIMICTLVNLSREYTGIKEVNCYLILVDLEQENKTIIKNIDSILLYMKNFCNEIKKIFVVGVTSKGNNKDKKIIKDEIVKLIEKVQMSFKYKEINKDENKTMADYLLNMFSYCYKNANNSQGDDKDDDESKSCIIF